MKQIQREQEKKINITNQTTIAKMTQCRKPKSNIKKQRKNRKKKKKKGRSRKINRSMA